MKIAILTANLGNFDEKNIDPVPQILEGHEIAFHRFTDKNFPLITGLTPRLQYRIPKMFGWQMFPGYDIYIWLDGSMSLQHQYSAEWLLEQLGENDMAIFKHPWRKTVREEVDHIEEYLQKGNKYITSRYKNGLHKEQYAYITSQEDGKIDTELFDSAVFIYRNTVHVQRALTHWWEQTTRFFTCDQIALPWVLSHNAIGLSVINEDIFKNPYVSLVSKHK